MKIISLNFLIKFENDYPINIKEIYGNDNNKIKSDLVIFAIKNIKSKIIENDETLNHPNKGYDNFYALLTKLNLSDIIK